jgi:hypothetical protein
MKRKICTAILALLATTAAAAPDSRPVYRTVPAPGVRHYLYEVVQTINGTTRKGYRTEFDLETKGNALFAVVRATAELDKDGWKPIVPDADCRKAMNGGETSLARVQLYPMDSRTAHDLGPGFLALCAPPAVFFPLTDILNVVVIPLPGLFRANALREAGDSRAFPGFDAAYDRAGERIQETAHGGEVRLAALDPHMAIIDWRPLPADLTLVEQNMKPPMTLQGTEKWAFRVGIDRRTGLIERASTTYDDLDMKIVGAPEAVPHVRISRSVTIEKQ